MFNNIGDKIKKVSMIICGIGIFCSGVITIGLIAIGKQYIIVSILIGLACALFSWISSFVSYGFGELIDSNQKILEELRNIRKEDTP